MSLVFESLRQGETEEEEKQGRFLLREGPENKTVIL